MITYIIRFVVVYFIVIFSMRFLGKRQIGQMQMSELVAAFFLSELATVVLTDESIPFLRGIFPIILLIALEVIVSFLAIKLPFMKKLVDFAPDFLIKDGKVLEKVMLKNRVTIDELLSYLRLNGYNDIRDVRFAILEPNGQLSVVPYAEHDVVTLRDMNLSGDEVGYSVAVIDDGKINEKALRLIGKTERWVKDELRKQKVQSVSEVFLLSANFKGETKLVVKEKN